MGLASAASLLIRVATGCSTSNGSAGSPDAGEDVSAADAAEAFDAGNGGSHTDCIGCSCFPVNACGGGGCYVTQYSGPNGFVSPFCGTGIAECGRAWSFGEANTCPGLNPSVPDYPVTYLDGGPDGAFCCDFEHEYALISDASADASAE